MLFTQNLHVILLMLNIMYLQHSLQADVLLHHLLNTDGLLKCLLKILIRLSALQIRQVFSKGQNPRLVQTCAGERAG